MGFQLTVGSAGVLFVAGIASGAVNAVAGGGSLISFPTMVALGVPPLVANATNAAAQWPGSLGAAIGFRNLVPSIRELLIQLLVPTVIGGLLGGWLLLSTPQNIFDLVVPILILFATLLLVFQDRLKQSFQKGKPIGATWVAWILQFAISLYGGYFGAGMGILMLALFGFIADRTLHELNALKSWLAVFINLLATVIFVIRGQVVWGACLSVMAGSVIGGLLAAKWSQRLPTKWLKLGVICLGFGMTAWFGYKAAVGLAR